MSLETRDLNVLSFYYFLFFFSSELKTNVRGRMAMARGRDHFSVGLRKKNREREREKRSNKEESTEHLLRCINNEFGTDSALMLPRHGANAKSL